MKSSTAFLQYAGDYMVTLDKKQHWCNNQTSSDVDGEVFLWLSARLVLHRRWRWGCVHRQLRFISSLKARQLLGPGGVPESRYLSLTLLEQRPMMQSCSRTGDVLYPRSMTRTRSTSAQGTWRHKNGILPVGVTDLTMSENLPRFTVLKKVLLPKKWKSLKSPSDMNTTVFISTDGGAYSCSHQRRPRSNHCGNVSRIPTSGVCLCFGLNQPVEIRYMFWVVHI